MELHKAKYWKTDETAEKVICELCPHFCRIGDGKAGICNARINRGGVLYTEVYSEIISLSMDPIEKKPLYHFYPGENILSTGPRGCNLTCQYCQNWSISQNDGPTSTVEPERLVALALRENSIGIAYTYTEPIIAFEYVIDCAKLAREKGLLNVMVTNGFINPAPLAELLEIIDAFNIDLKSMDDGFYRKICGGRLEPVLDSIEAVAASDAHLEITNLIIPGYNDSPEKIAELVDFVEAIDPLIPVHFSGYYPAYKFTAPPTKTETLHEAFDIASEKLRYVFVGNRRTDCGNDSFCPQCGNLLVARSGFTARVTGITDTGECDNCGRPVDLVGKWSRRG